MNFFRKCFSAPDATGIIIITVKPIRNLIIKQDFMHQITIFFINVGFDFVLSIKVTVIIVRLTDFTFPCSFSDSAICRLNSYDQSRSPSLRSLGRNEGSGIIRFREESDWPLK